MNHGAAGALDAVDAGHFSYAQEEPTKSPSRFTEYFLCFVGASAAILGTALTFAPGLAPELGKVVGRLARFGIEPSSVLVTGVTFFALGMLAHVFTKSVSLMRPQVQQQNDDSEFMLVADQLATDMAQTLSTLLQISSEIAELSENNRTLLRNMPDPNGQATANQTPMFRLAASVDQLCANVDTRLANLGQELSSSMQGVSSSLSMVKSELEHSKQQPVVAAPLPVVVSEPKVEVLENLEDLEQPRRQRSEQVVEPEAPAALPHPMDTGSAGSIELDVSSESSGSQSESLENPALDIFDQMEGHPMDDPKPAAPLPSGMPVDALDDLMPKHSNPQAPKQD